MVGESNRAYERFNRLAETYIKSHNLVIEDQPKAADQAIAETISAEAALSAETQA